MTRMRALVLVVLIAASFLLATASVAGAHPLGNFSINRFSGIEVMPERVTVHYVVDMAEVPTFQQRGDLDADGDELITTDELASHAARAAQGLVANLSLWVEDRRVEITVESASARLGRGQGGLDVLRMEFNFTGELPSSDVRLRYEDGNYSAHLGWSEVVAYASGGRGIAAADVPSESLSNELRSYPRDLLASPLDVTAATVDVASGAVSVDSQAERPQEGPAGGPAGTFSSLVERELSPAVTAGAVLVALVSGGLHALGPGHGKTVMAAYLVGTAGSARHAIAVGVAVSLMHTASVIGLCFVTLWAQSLFAPETVYPWLSLSSGVVVGGLGATLLWTRLRRRNVAGHDHSHAHSHGGQTHSHSPAAGAPERSPLSWRGLGALALSGGLLPSPTALVVLLGAIALDRIAFGVVLVLSFSVGLAAALTLTGVLVLRARDFAERRLGARSAALLPLLSAAAILAMGVFLTTRAALGF